MSSLNLDLTVSNGEHFCVRGESTEREQAERKRRPREREREERGRVEEARINTPSPPGDVLTGRKGPPREEGGRR